MSACRVFKGHLCRDLAKMETVIPGGDQPSERLRDSILQKNLTGTIVYRILIFLAFRTTVNDAISQGFGRAGKLT